MVERLVLLRKFKWLHFVTWSVWLGYHLVVFAQFEGNLDYFENYLAFFIVHMLLFYVHAYAVMPLVYHKRVYLYGLSGILLLEFSACFFLFTLISLAFGDLHIDWSFSASFFDVQNVKPFVQPFLGYIGAASALYIFEQIYLQRDVVTAHWLTRRINLHFITHYLGKQYMDWKKSGHESVRSLQWLQEYTAFMLMDEQEKPRPIEAEVTALKRLLAMQRVRHGSAFSFFLKVDDTALSFLLIPMLLIPLAENILQHGVYLDPDSPAYMRVCFIGNVLMVTATNRIKGSGTKEKTYGMALQNMQQRLELHHAGKFTLNYGAKGDVFELRLQVWA